MIEVPPDFCHGPFTYDAFRAAGLSPKLLRGRRFRRLFPRVWAHVDHVMTWSDWVLAAHLTLPPDARLTGITRLQQLGIDHGPDVPLHFVGDWLLREGHMSLEGLVELARHDDWRAGSAQAVWIARYLDARSWSATESMLRAAVIFAGLPRPELNLALSIRGRKVVVDLAWLKWRVVVEYEGGHHQTDRAQYLHDLDRYGLLRTTDLDYLQVTKEQMRNVIAVVTKVYAALADGGYDGPSPEFGRHFRRLYRRIPVGVRPPRR